MAGERKGGTNLNCLMHALPSFSVDILDIHTSNK